MSKLNLMKTHKRLYAAAGALEMATGGAPKKDRLLIKLRASFENGCRFCINMHTREARKQGFDRNWVANIKSWPATRGQFDERDNLILEFATAGTRLSDGPFDPALQEKVIAEFGEKGTGDFIAVIATINLWNRIGVLSQK